MDGQIDNITRSLIWILPEISLAAAFIIVLIAGMVKVRESWMSVIALAAFSISITISLLNGFIQRPILFDGMLHLNGYSSYLKLLMDGAGILTVILDARNPRQHRSEFLGFLIVVVLGSHLLAMTSHYLMIFLSLEIISIGSYVLVGFSFTKTSGEGSLKYFLFGAVASALMLYGFSILYGLTGSLDFGFNWFADNFVAKSPALFATAIFLVLAGMLYKVAAFPMHLWSPDAYEAAPLPVLAFLSVVPKFAGFAVLLKLVATLFLANDVMNWQFIISVVALMTITVGNFSALHQLSAKRMMAYSSIGQSGFLLIAIVAIGSNSLNAFLFYATVYLLMNFSVISNLQFFERLGFKTIADFKGSGRYWIIPSITLLIGLIALTGLPPTAGFTAKLFIFSALWESYELTGKVILLVLMVFGLVNTVISLFYYLRIPYFAFLKIGQPVERQNIVTFENLLSIILVLLLLVLFFLPGMLMGWINKINFVV